MMLVSTKWKPLHFGSLSIIQLPTDVEDAVLYVKGSMLQLLHIKRLYGGQSDQVPYNDIRKFLDVCNLFTFKDFS